MAEFLDRLQSGSSSLGIEERQQVLRFLVQEILVDQDTMTTQHSIPITRAGTPPSGGGGTTEKSGYLFRSGSHGHVSVWHRRVQVPSDLQTRKIQTGSGQSPWRVNQVNAPVLQIRRHGKH